MEAIDSLKRDHKLLRSKLDVIDATLKMGPESWFVLRELCLTLSRQLEDHINREEELVAVCRNVMNPKVLAEIAVEHRDEPERLKVLKWLFFEERNHDMEQIRPALTEVLQGLRHHMTEEERELFPILERELAARESVRAR